ncbi:Aste57867_1164 [Aphanomyces stellatus]|uniref:Aste57867_1164 protein n=1 Tax=Aphanomyces stellatus TaxID=120398 RepID=A0A485K4I7_9STRA|nr:hypothetical protein As57867_001163 [Aphanomyces stellatus]VFT78384.1 Aste57867_1164 [Aphanomyces stellatus]
MKEESPGEKREMMRVYFRDKQREYRIKQRSKHSKMTQRIQELETILLKGKSQGGLRRMKPARERDLLLPWDVIADIMKSERGQAESTQRELRRRVQETTAVIQDMQRFATVQHVSQHFLAAPPTFPCAQGMLQSSAWRHVTLFANTESRRLGKKWITENMFLNAKHVFQHYQFPPPDSQERMQDYNLIFTEECYFLVQRSHQFYDVPMEAFRRMTHLHLCSLLLLAGASEYDDPTEECDMRRQITSLGECINVILGEFRGPNRCTHVIQQIQDDERWPHEHRQRNRIELERVGLCRTKLRALSIISQSRRKDGFVSLTEEAPHLELDGDCTSEDSFRRQMLARTSRNRHPVKNEIPTILAKLTADVLREEAAEEAAT